MPSIYCNFNSIVFNLLLDSLYYSRVPPRRPLHDNPPEPPSPIQAHTAVAAWHLHSPPSHQNGTGARASATPGTSDHNIRRGPRPPVTSTHAGDQVHGHVLCHGHVPPMTGETGTRETGAPRDGDTGGGGDRRYGCGQPAGSQLGSHFD